MTERCDLILERVLAQVVAQPERKAAGTEVDPILLKVFNNKTIAGGSGAGPDFDGASAVQTHMTNSRLTAPEVLELRFPVLVDEFSIRRGSGGDGVVRKIRFRQAMTAGILSGHRIVPPYGAAGGQDAQVGRNYVLRATGQREALESTAEVTMGIDDVFVIETPGGGSFGNR